MRGQVSVDFLVTLTIALLMFLVVMNVAVNRRHDARDFTLNYDARHKAQELAGVINDAYLAGDGAARNVTLYATLEGAVSYDVTVYDRGVLVSYVGRGERDAFARTFAGEVSGGDAGVDIEPGLIYVENIEGVIHVRSD